MSENRYAIGKYVPEHENAAAFHHFKNNFPSIKESTVREKENMKNNYNRQRNKLFNLLNLSKITPQRQDNRCFWINLNGWFKIILKG